MAIVIVCALLIGALFTILIAHLNRVERQTTEWLAGMAEEHRRRELRENNQEK